MITQTQPGTERGGVGRTKYAGTTPNPAEQLRKRVLYHNRAARLPILAMALNGGEGRMKQEGTPQNPDPKTQKTSKTNR